MLPKPSLVLQVKLIPGEYSEAAAAEIKRSFMSQAQSIVSEAIGVEIAEGNVMRLTVRLMRPYWDVDDPASEELWHKSFMPWLANVTRNISTAMHNFNTVLHPLGSGNVYYEWADFDFSPHSVLRVKVDEENRIPSCAPDLCDKVRTLSNGGELGEDVVLIRMPSHESLASQIAAHDEAVRAYEKALSDYEEARAAYEQAVALREQNGEVDTDAPCPEAPVKPVSPGPLALNYDQWAIEYADGTVRLFDSTSF